MKNALPKTAPVVAQVAPSKALLPPWLVLANSQKGIHEGDGITSNPKVIRYFVEAGHPEVHNDHTTPWCAAFVGAMLKESGFEPTGTLWALDYAKWGQKLDPKKPVIGAIGTKTRNGGGHVFFVVGVGQGFVYALGGNQNDQVCVERIPTALLHSLSWPTGYPLGTAVAGGVTAGSSNAREA